MSVSVSNVDVSHFERRLRDRMAELRGEIESVRARKAEEPFERIAGEAPDAVDSAVATVTFDAENAEIRRDEAELREIDEALGRIAAGSYGICLRCGRPLEHARLEEEHEKEEKLRPTPPPRRP
jgi:DnaK suppressor protein